MSNETEQGLQIISGSDTQQMRNTYVADIVGDAYKSWDTGRIAIEANTGTGKTEFVIKTLYRWLVNERLHKITGIIKMLYLCNRKALERDIKRKVKDVIEADNGTIGHEPLDELTAIYDDCIDIKTYQNIEERIKHGEDTTEIFSGYSIVVADECHYFFDDADFNENTDMMYWRLDEATRDRLVIYMTATPGNMFSAWECNGKLAKEWHYHLLRKCEHITDAYVYFNNAERQNILESMPDAEKAIVFVKSYNDLVRMQKIYGNEAGYYCSKNNIHGAIDELESCVLDCVLQKRILFTTEALYNGIDIKDRTLKHILIEHWEPIKIIQAMGRKRPLDESDSCTVYYRGMAEGNIKSMLGKVVYKLEPAEAWLSKKKGDTAQWEAFLNRETANKQIDDCAALTFNHTKRDYVINIMLVIQMRQRRKVLEEMRDSSYWNTIDRWVWSKLLQETPKIYGDNKLKEYISEHLDEPMSKDDLWNGIMQAGSITHEPGRSKNRVVGKTLLNNKLKAFGVKIIPKRNKIWIRGHGTTITLYMITKS